MQKRTIPQTIHAFNQAWCNCTRHLLFRRSHRDTPIVSRANAILVIGALDFAIADLCECFESHVDEVVAIVKDAGARDIDAGHLKVLGIEARAKRARELAGLDHNQIAERERLLANAEITILWIKHGNEQMKIDVRSLELTARKVVSTWRALVNATRPVVDRSRVMINSAARRVRDALIRTRCESLEMCVNDIEHIIGTILDLCRTNDPVQAQRGIIRDGWRMLQRGLFNNTEPNAFFFARVEDLRRGGTFFRPLLQYREVARGSDDDRVLQTSGYVGCAFGESEDEEEIPNLQLPDACLPVQPTTTCETYRALSEELTVQSPTEWVSSILSGYSH